MKRIFWVVTGLALAGAVVPVRADTLLVDRVKSESSALMPGRGMTMAQVESRYGAPVSKAAPVGGESPQHPPITRWNYADYSVYFEHDHVVDSVLNKATAREEGPKPAQK
jgi:hypothetical protein